MTSKRSRLTLPVALASYTCEMASDLKSASPSLLAQYREDCPGSPFTEESPSPISEHAEQLHHYDSSSPPLTPVRRDDCDSSPRTPSRKYDHPLVYSSPSSTMPPFPESADEVLHELLENYHNFISAMRHGVTIGEGPHWLGQCARAVGEKFLEQQDRRYPAMLLPALHDYVDVYLTGDPSYTHELLAMLFVNKTRAFRRHHPAIPELDRMEAILTGSMEWCAAPRTPVTVSEAGQVKARRFLPGTALKEPDCMVLTGNMIPLESQRNLCVMEIAYHNEDVSGLVTEAKLWSQQSQKTTTAHRHRHQPLNFIGLHVGTKPENKLEEGEAFGLFLCPARGSTDRGADLYLFNATQQYRQDWENVLRKARLPLFVNKHFDVAAEIGYNFLCPLLRQLPAFDDLNMTISVQDLNRTLAQAQATENNTAGNESVEPDMSALYASISA